MVLIYLKKWVPIPVSSGREMQICSLARFSGKRLSTPLDYRWKLYDTDGAKGAALGAGIGAGVYRSFDEAFEGLTMINSLEPDTSKQEQYRKAFLHWESVLQSFKI